MKWRAVRKAGAQAPALAAESGDYVPQPTGSKNSVILVSKNSGKEYRVDIMDPLNVGASVNIIHRPGSNYEIREVGLWEPEMFPGGTSTLTRGSPPFRGSQNLLGTEFDPVHDPADWYDWQHTMGHILDSPEAMTAEEVTATCWNKDFDSNVRGGTNLWDMLIDDLKWKAENTKFRVGASLEFSFNFKSPTTTYPRISFTVTTMNYSDEMPQSYYTDEGIFKYWTPAGVSDLACFKSVSFGSNVGPRGMIYYGYGSRYGLPDGLYKAGKTGFAKYGEPRMYLILLPNGNLTLASYVVNNSNNGSESSQWPYVGGYGQSFAPGNYGIEMMPGIPGGGSDVTGNFQYRFPGWAQFRR